MPREAEAAAAGGAGRALRGRGARTARSSPGGGSGSQGSRGPRRTRTPHTAGSAARSGGTLRKDAAHPPRASAAGATGTTGRGASFIPASDSRPLSPAPSRGCGRGSALGARAAGNPHILTQNTLTSKGMSESRLKHLVQKRT